MRKAIFFLTLLCLVETACGSDRAKLSSNNRRYELSLNELFHSYAETQDTSKSKNVSLPEVAVAGVRGIQHVGLSNLKPEYGYRGITGDRMAVYIPYPKSSINYVVTAVEVALRNPKYSPAFEQGTLQIQLCKASSIDQPPGEPMLAQDLLISPKDQKKAHNGVVTISLNTPLELPSTGLYVVASWNYERTGKDITTREIRSASLAANLSLSESYTWNGTGDLRSTWRREGEANSMSKALKSLNGKLFNAMMGVSVREKD